MHFITSYWFIVCIKAIVLVYICLHTRMLSALNICYLQCAKLRHRDTMLGDTWLIPMGHRNLKEKQTFIWVIKHKQMYIFFFRKVRDIAVKIFLKHIFLILQWLFLFIPYTSPLFPIFGFLSSFWRYFYNFSLIPDLQVR